MSVALSAATHMATRAEWGARAPKSRAGFDPDTSTAHWEGPSMGWPWNHAACYSLVRGIQRFHMDTRGWADIAYNLVVCPHGTVFEGRGKGTRSGANGTNTGNARANAVCYLGGIGDPFTPEGQRAMRDAFAWLGERNHNGHRDWKATQCPGDDIYNWVRAGMPGTTAPTPPPPPPAGPPAFPVLRWGSRGDHVVGLQDRLKQLGIDVGRVDGIFGNLTLAGVKAFQVAEQIDNDGIVGPDTWGRLDKPLHVGRATPPPAAPTPPAAPAVPAFPLPAGHWFGPESRDGRNHSGYWAQDRAHVAAIHRRLSERGWRNVPGGDRYTARTADLVAQFQAEKGYRADGLTGRETWPGLWTARVT